MEIIRKKICYEPLRSRRMGLIPYVPFNSDIPQKGYCVSGANGNWGGFVMNFTTPEGNERNYLEMMEKYYALKKQITSSRKLYLVNGTTYFDIKEDDYTKDYNYHPMDKNKYPDNLDRDPEGNLYGHIMLIEDFTTFTLYGGISFCEEVEKYIGILQIPDTIEGTMVPNTLEYCKINDYYEWLVANKDSLNCCTKEEWENKGGEAMIAFLSGKTSLMKDRIEELNGTGYTYEYPTINVPIYINGEIDDIGIYTEYKDYDNLENIDEEHNIRYSGGTLGPKWKTFSVNDGIEMESFLKTLRVPDMFYDDSGDELPGLFVDYIKYWKRDESGNISNATEKEAVTNGYEVTDLISGGTEVGYYMSRCVNNTDNPLEIPYKTGYTFNSIPVMEIDPETGEEKQKTDTSGNLLFRGDFIKAITKESSAITFETIQGGQYYATPTSGTFVTYVEHTGIDCKETYLFYPKKEITVVVDGIERTLYCDYIDFDASLRVISEETNGTTRLGLVTNIIGLPVEDVWASGSAVNNLIIKDETLMGVATPDKVDASVEVDRGGAIAMEKHYRLSECNTMEDLENCGNNYFNL